MDGREFGLGIDFGTSNTVAMLRWPDERVRPVLFDGSPLLPSAVFASSDGRLVVGSDALRHGRFLPGQLEPNPKRHIDEDQVLLGSREVAVVDLLAAVLRHVVGEVVRVTGGVPRQVALSYPAAWAAVRRGRLVEAARAAGLGHAVLVPEPTAAADYFTAVLGRTVPIGKALVVYDLGAGTFDTSAVVHRSTGFDVAAVDGLAIGGLDIDATIIAWIRDRFGSRRPGEWNRLTDPTNADDTLQRRTLWDDARAAKESLSRTAAVPLRLPALGVDIQLTRDEFEAAAEPLLSQTVRTTTTMIRNARLSTTDIAGLLLVGGASRIPLVGTLLHRTLGIPPTATEQPELVVAEGALQTIPYDRASAPTLIGVAVRDRPAIAARLPAAPVSPAVGAGVSSRTRAAVGAVVGSGPGPPSASGSATVSSVGAGRSSVDSDASGAGRRTGTIYVPGPRPPANDDAHSGDSRVARGPTPTADVPRGRRLRLDSLIVALLLLMGVAVVAYWRPWPDTPPNVAMAVSPDGKTLATAGEGATVHLWDVAGRRQLGRLLFRQNAPIESLVFSPDGRMLAGASDRAVRLWDVASWTEIGNKIDGATGQLAFSPDGRTLAARWRDDNTMRLWDVVTHQQVGPPFAGHTDYVRSVAFSPDGKVIASGSPDRTVRLWDVASRREFARIGDGPSTTQGSGPVWSLAFSPDGKILAGGLDQPRLWNVATRSEIGAPLAADTPGIRDLAFSPDGKTLATADGNTARLWDVATRRQLGEPLTGHTGSVWSVAFSPDGRTLFTASLDQTVRLWDVSGRVSVSTLQLPGT